jgi:DnaJ-class molecular chaperone
MRHRATDAPIALARVPVEDRRCNRRDMMKDPYQTLGVRRTASADEIKRSYRRLAKKLHPDVNPDKRVEQQFRDVTAAYDLLSDPAKRARFDRGEIDAAGAERGFSYTRGDGGGRTRAGEEDVFVEDIISEMFRARRGGGRSARAARGSDASFTLPVPFLEAVLGAKKRVTLADGKTLDVTVPSGIDSGQTLRLKGQGNPGSGGAPDGDALIEIQIEPHPVFTRKARDIHSELPVTLQEAVLGGSVTVPTVHGPVALKVPPGSNSGTTLRLKGKGLPARGLMPAGDQYVKLRVVLPDPPDPALKRFLETWSPTQSYTVRNEPGMG